MMIFYRGCSKPIGLLNQELEHVINESNFINNDITETRSTPVYLREGLSDQLIISHKQIRVHLIIPKSFGPIGSLI